MEENTDTDDNPSEMEESKQTKVLSSEKDGCETKKSDNKPSVYECKQKFNYNSKSVLEFLNTDKDLMGLSDNASDSEIDLNEEEENSNKLSSDDNNEDEGCEYIEPVVENARVSKKISREKSKAILKKVLDDKGPIDWSDDPSDFEEEMKKDKQKLYTDSSDDDSENEMKREKQENPKQIKHQDDEKQALPKPKPRKPFLKQTLPNSVKIVDDNVKRSTLKQTRAILEISGDEEFIDLKDNKKTNKELPSEDKMDDNNKEG